MAKSPHPSRIFKTPDELFNAWNEYKQSRLQEAETWQKVQYVGKDGMRVTDTPPMPLDIDGFFTWYYDKYKRYIHQYFDGTHDYGEEFLGIVTRIIAERNNNIKTGTLLGFFNPSMGIRIVGLADKKETEIKGSLNIPNVPDIGNRS